MVRQDQQCDRMGVIYNITCNQCNSNVDTGGTNTGDTGNGDSTEKYIGMTRTSIHNRMVGHLRDQKSKKESSPLYRHDVDRHSGQTQTYTASIVAAEKKIVKLSCLEAIHIERYPDHLLWNERNERGRGGVVRVMATRVS